MGREIKRVALDFDWPLGRTWDGFINPHYEKRKDCPHCKGGGYNPETQKLSDDWYDFDKTGRRWCDNITQDEVDKLIEEKRLWDFWRRVGENGWEDIEPRPEVTAAQVNAWSAGRGLGHDACNQAICVRYRAERLGVYGLCAACGGDGDSWETPGAKAAAESWETTEPPAGDGWQIWETVSEGSPVTPVCATAEELIDYLCEPGDQLDNRGFDRETAEAWVRGPGWAPSLVVSDGRVMSGIEGVVEARKERA